MEGRETETCRVVHETGRVEADGVNPGIAEAGHLDWGLPLSLFFPVPCLFGAPRSNSGSCSMYGEVEAQEPEWDAR